ncbi:ABC transporter ATP-binding protein [Salipaludibacillus aurantiacus]|uniref:ATP-binding cassette, subfamily C n=1 Tax=Salipaludibacillus aurantiacus TaxID=1601833 RepID=A0A1H9UKP8_9BACI|nr:ABC transporter ATP-binding protein [Salipaludibacillus aurantiacus]SES10120.1 ATP-binding cassette, subfamily C [Salipaludibacillus aurantiacus]
MKPVFYFLKQIHLYAGKILYFNLIAMSLIGLLDGIGILLLIPMLSMSGVVELDAGGTPVAGLFEFLQGVPASVGLPVILLIFVLIAVAQNLLQRQITVKNAMIQHGFFRYMRVKTYQSLLNANWRFFIKKRKSDLVNLLTAEIARASAGTHSFLQFFASLIFTLIQIGIAIWLSPVITAFVMICGLVLIFLNRKFLKRSHALGQRNFTLGKAYLGGITDQINGIKDIKSNTLEESRMDWYRSITKQMEQEQVEYTKLKTKSQLYYKVASACLIAVFIFIAIHLFQAQGAELLLIIVIFSRLWPKVAGIQGSLEDIATKLPAFKAVVSLQEEAEKSQELAYENADGANVRPLRMDKGIECRNVFFRYREKEEKYALKNINLFLPANHMTAVVGRSGAGKSTLIDTLMGLNEPASGEVLIDGTPLTRENLIAWRRAISYVPQDPFLFNESIKENLKLVKPDATDTDIWEALEFSSAAEFVKKLPEGIDTLIGDRGIRLSGGERQRLVIARAILRKPSVLILDEATSSLDTENELKIQQALERLKGEMTIIVIAHRLSTIRNADQVLVLDEGRLIEKGKFGQLADKKRGVFNNLLKSQVNATL